MWAAHMLGLKVKFLKQCECRAQCLFSQHHQSITPFAGILVTKKSIDFFVEKQPDFYASF
jgi:hypothetical protein